MHQKSVLIIGLDLLLKQSLQETKNLTAPSLDTLPPNDHIKPIIQSTLEKADVDLHIIGNCSKQHHNPVRIWLQKHFDLSRYPKHVICQLADETKKQDHSLQMVEAINNLIDTKPSPQKISIYTSDSYVADFFAKKLNLRPGIIWNIFMPDTDSKPTAWKASYTI